MCASEVEEMICYVDGGHGLESANMCVKRWDQVKVGLGK